MSDGIPAFGTTSRRLLDDQDRLRADLLGLDPDALPPAQPLAHPQPAYQPPVEPTPVEQPAPEPVDRERALYEMLKGSAAQPARSAPAESDYLARFREAQKEERKERERARTERKWDRVSQAVFAASSVGPNSQLPASFFSEQDQPESPTADVVKELQFAGAVRDSEATDTKRRHESEMRDARSDLSARARQHFLDVHPLGKEYAAKMGPRFSMLSAAELPDTSKLLERDPAALDKFNDARDRRDASSAASRRAQDLVGFIAAKENPSWLEQSKDLLPTLSADEIEETILPRLSEEGKRSFVRERDRAHAALQRELASKRAAGHGGVDEKLEQEVRHWNDKVPADIRAGLEALDNIDAQIQEAGGIDKISGVGPIDQFRPGLLLDDRGQVVRQQLQDVVNTYLKATSGAAVSDQEYQRIRKALSGSGSEQEVTNGLRILRRKFSNLFDSKTAAARPEIRERLREAHIPGPGSSPRTVRMRDPQGQMFEVDASEAQQAEANGWKRAQ